MATTVDTLLVRIETDMKGVRQDLKRLEQRTKQSTDKMNKSFSGMGKVFKLAVAAVIVREVARATGALIKLASDAQEMQAKSSVVFGAYTNDVRLFAKNLANDVGRSALALEGMAATVQDTFVPMGFSRKEGAELSKTLTQLAVDVGSFNNKADAEVMRAFQSALVGNHETLRQFGVVITEATLKQELLNMGVQGGTKAATEQEKVQARLNLLMAGTTDAQGDAARTADSFANRVKALQGQLQDLGSRLGATLIPVATKVVEVFSEIVTTIENVLLKLGIIAPTAAEAIATKLNLEKEALITAEKDLKELLETSPQDMGLPPNNQLNNPILQNILTNNPALAEMYEKSTGGDLTQAKIMADQKNLKGIQDNIHMARIRAVQAEIEILSKKLTISERQRIAEERALEIQEKRAKMEAKRAKLLENQASASSRNKLTDRARREFALFLPQDDSPRLLGNQGVGTSSTLLQSKLRNDRLAEQKLNDEARKNHVTRIAQITNEIEFIEKKQRANLKGLELSKEERIEREFERIFLAEKKDFPEDSRALEFQEQRIRNIARQNINLEDAKQKTIDLNALRQKADAIIESNTSALDKLNQQQKEANKLKELGLLQDKEYEAQMAKILKQIKELDPMTKIIADGLKQVADTISNSLADAFMTGKLSFESLANVVKQTVGQIIAHVLKMQVIAPILRGLGVGGGVMSALGFAASGGAMQPNRPYIVGERGPELFVPSGAGTLMNNMNTQNAMSGTSTIINQSINLSTGVAQTVHAEVLNLLPAIKEQTMIAVSDSKRRGGAFAKVMG